MTLSEEITVAYNRYRELPWLIADCAVNLYGLEHTAVEIRELALKARDKQLDDALDAHLPVPDADTRDWSQEAKDLWATYRTLCYRKGAAKRRMNKLVHEFRELRKQILPHPQMGHNQ